METPLESPAAPASAPPLLDPAYPLATERLCLRPYVVDDLDALLGMFGRPDVCRYLDWEPMDGAAARTLLERRVGQTRIERDGEGIALAIADPASNAMIGEVVLRLTSAPDRQGEVGWSLHPDAQGHGFATEAAREMLRLGFDVMGLHRIVAECDPRNEASIRVMERLGMRREAHMLDTRFIKGEWVGSMIYAMLESEWPDARAARGLGRGEAA